MRHFSHSSLGLCLRGWGALRLAPSSRGHGPLCMSRSVSGCPVWSSDKAPRLFPAGVILGRCSRETEFHSYLEEMRQLSLSQLGLGQQKPAKTDDFFHPKFSGLNTHNVQNSVKNHVSIKGHEKSQLEWENTMNRSQAASRWHVHACVLGLSGVSVSLWPHGQ